MRRSCALLLLSVFLLGASAAWAEEAAEPADEPAEEAKPREPKPDLFDSGKLLGTGGVTQLEGAAGGGLVPWAVITGYGTRDAIGASAHYTYITLSDFQIQSGGVALGLFDRVELSATHQEFNTQQTGAKLGFGKGYTFDQDIYGAKVRLLGDAVYDQDSLLPQIAAGLQYKVNDRGAQLRAIGAKHDRGVDYYLSATKVFLGQSLLLNVTLRETKANQYGILGFGGDRHDTYQLQYEGSAAFFVTREAAVGAEYRTKPNNLSAANEGNAFDVFLAYFFNKNLSATLAYLDLGDIATQKNQRGAYFSLQVGF
ncbi:MAG TPA: DUF3034 family protein [Alphaproteobacteria bacterium]